MFWWTLTAIAAAVVIYPYLVYPAILKLLTFFRRQRSVAPRISDWPLISLTIPAYNEAAQIDDLLQSVLHLDYPRDRLQILVVSDASDDGTDEIVARYADRGIELLRMPSRVGKSAAENAARAHLRGDIIVNTDASIRIRPDALKRLIAEFEDPEVGLASGRDVSVTRVDGELNAGESTYVGYEMWIRSLESDLTGIVGASGCFYAIRRDLHEHSVPPGLSRDFAAALVARERGYRAVSVNNAICYVPRSPSLRREYQRKVRTIARGMGTLHFKRHLMNPFRFGLFSWMLISHKVCRWAAPWGAMLGLVGISMLAPTNRLATLAAIGAVIIFLFASIGWRWPEGRTMPRMFSLPAFLVAGNIAVLHATLRAVRGRQDAVWEPTRRDSPRSTPAPTLSGGERP